MSDSDYGIQVGEGGRGRLQALNLVHNPKSIALLESQGLTEGMDVLDVGCGIGLMTEEIAQRVGSGRVVGVDLSASQLALAPRRENIEYVCAAAEDLGGVSGSFDLIYCRCLLEHIKEPMQAIEQMSARLNPGGRLICEASAGVEAHFSDPQSQAYDSWSMAAKRWTEHQGTDFAIGRKLPQLLRELGLEVVYVNEYQPILRAAEEKSLLTLSLVEAGPAFVAAGLATAAETEEMYAGLMALEADEATVAGYTPIAQVVAVKPL